jgi:hypothetical protein
LEQLMNDTKINLTLNLVNGILQYLGTRPYAEVFPIVQEIQAQALPQVPTPNPADEPAAAGLND